MLLFFERYAILSNNNVRNFENETDDVCACHVEIAPIAYGALGILILRSMAVWYFLFLFTLPVLAIWTAVVLVLISSFYSTSWPIR